MREGGESCIPTTHTHAQKKTVIACVCMVVLHASFMPTLNDENECVHVSARGLLGLTCTHSFSSYSRWVWIGDGMSARL